MKFHLLLLCLLVCVASTSSSTILCHDIERSALLHFKQSFSIHCSHSANPFPYAKTLSWKPTGDGSDCCEWEGVECDEHTGHVLGLDLSSSCLFGSLPSNSTLFELIHLQALNLSDNNFRYSRIPSELGHLLNLKYLNLSQSRLYGQVPIEVSTLSNLISLDLSNNLDPLSSSQLLKLQHQSLAQLVMNLTALEVLTLSQVNISTSFPEKIADLTSLRSLRLVNCALQGSFPERIFHLPKLQVLNLAENTNLSGYFTEFGSSSILTVLNIDNTLFQGQIPPSISNLQSLEVLSLYGCNFEGSIPVSLGQLSQLTYLDLSYNNLVGTVLISLVNLTQLTYLDLSYCYFQEYLPIGLGKLYHLESLKLSRNGWIGEIPRALSNLTRLLTLDIAYNNFVGGVQHLANLTQLVNLNLNFNRLQGSIRSFISGLTNLENLELCENNFTGPQEFDIFVGHQKLQTLGLSNIDLIFSTKNHNNSYYPQFARLFLECNLIRFPDFLHNQTRLSVLQLGNNRIEGTVPMPPPSTLVYDLGANRFKGKIPTTICNATSLKILHLGYNRLSGTIPPCLVNLSDGLESLDLEANYLHGTIPDSFTSMCELKWLNLQENKLEGALPRSLVNCSSLQMLLLGNNGIVDTFPIWLSSLLGLQIVLMGANKLHGPLPERFGLGFPNLIVLQLSHNHFTGAIPDELFNKLYAMEKPSPQYIAISLTISSLGGEIIVQYFEFLNDNGQDLSHPSLYLAMSVDISNNRLTGKLPESIGNLHELQGLNLSYNNLTGGIPSSFGDLTSLLWLDLSHNLLSGEIPQGLAQLSFLSQFNVSYNQLTGPIPQDGHLNTFDNDSFVGNTGLCGIPLSKKCGNPEVQAASPNDSSSEENEDSTDVIGWVIISMGYISGLVVGVIIGRMITDENHDWFVETFGRKQHKKKKKKQRNIR